MTIPVIWITAAILYFIFYSWYVGFNKPLKKEEIEEGINYLKNSPMDDEQISIMKEFCENDDGKEFVMVNLLELQRPIEESKKKLETYSKSFFANMVKRAGHPIYLGRNKGGYIDNVGMGENHWDNVFLVRYRSRRDCLKVIASDDFFKAHHYKLDALVKTMALPTMNMGMPFNAQKVVFLLFTSIAAFAHIIHLS